MKKPRRSIADYARCDGCGAFRHRLWFLPKKGEPVGNRCCGHQRIKTIAFHRTEDGIVQAKVRWYEGLRYYWDQIVDRFKDRNDA
jgi:hypothetical protein